MRINEISCRDNLRSQREEYPIKVTQKKWPESWKTKNVVSRSQEKNVFPQEKEKSTVVGGSGG